MLFTQSPFSKALDEQNVETAFAKILRQMRVSYYARNMANAALAKILHRMRVIYYFCA